MECGGRDRDPVAKQALLTVTVGCLLVMKVSMFCCPAATSLASNSVAVDTARRSDLAVVLEEEEEAESRTSRTNSATVATRTQSSEGRWRVSIEQASVRESIFQFPAHLRMF